MAGKLKLYYFNGRGRGEVSRLLCKEGDIEFEDIRVDGKSDWKAGANLKDKMPFGQMPVLELKDGTKIAQSAAIERYLARLGKLYGKDETEAAVIDMVCEGLTDTLKGLMKALFESGSDENVKKAAILKYFNDAESGWPRWGAQLNAILKANKSGWFVGSSISLADIISFNHLSNYVLPNNADALKNFPELQALIKAVEARPKIAAWLKARPATAF